MRAPLLFVLALASSIYGLKNVERDISTNYHHVCNTIAGSISSASAVFYPGSAFYVKDIYHYANSSTQQATCTVEPGTAADVGKILKIVGETRTPFGVKSGGHALNPGFSSSPGVQIALYRFSSINYDAKTQTVEIGSGLIFDDVYAALAPDGVSIAGGRVTGIGVGGFLLGGGYSWKANQDGLAIDTITAYELVKPDGEMVTVTEHSDAELFFGLKGGLNNFGVVTRFTLKALPQPPIWGGTILYPPTSIPQATSATIKFAATNTDPKANIITSYLFFQGEPIVAQMLYYDGPSPPAGLFDDFLNIPSISSDVKERTLSNFIGNTLSNQTANLRGVYHTVPILEYTPNLMKVIQNETIFWGEALLNKTGLLGYNVEPFLPSMLSHNKVPTAYPPTRNRVYTPFNLAYAWEIAEFDEIFFDAIRQSAATIRAAALAEGQDITHGSLYPNYAIFDTPLSQIYGDHVDKLKSLRRRVDPADVMGLAGGFKF